MENGQQTQKRSWKQIITEGCRGIAVLLAAAVICVGIRAIVPHRAESCSLFWQCVIVLEEYGTHEHSGSYVPEGATLVGEVDAMGVDSDGQIAGRTQYLYESEGWETGRILITKGDADTEPYFDEVTLAGNEREKERKTDYYVSFTTKDGETTEKISEAQFRRIAADGYVRYTRAALGRNLVAYTVCS